MTFHKTMLEVAQAIAADVETLDEPFVAKGFPSPSFDTDMSSGLALVKGSTVAEAHRRLLDRIRQLQRMILGPMGWLREMSLPEDLFSLSFIDRFEIANVVPLEGEMSFQDIADRIKVPSLVVTRILRYAMTNGVFTEPRHGFVAHSDCSRLLAEDAFVQGMVYMGCSERFIAAAKHVEALQKHPESEDPTLSGRGLANDAKAPMFEELALSHPVRAERVNKYMALLATRNHADLVPELYDWGSLDKAHIVDVAGGKGAVSIALARRFHQLQLTVQDLGQVVTSGERNLPHHLNDRIRFQQHDMFCKQPIHGADVYLFRNVLHDWSDKYCIQILQALIPALKTGSRVVFIEPYIPTDETMTAWEERQIRSADLRMMIYVNGCDREIGHWESLFGRADPRFCHEKTHLSPSTSTSVGSASMALFAATWTG